MDILLRILTTKTLLVMIIDFHLTERLVVLHLRILLMAQIRVRILLVILDLTELLPDWRIVFVVLLLINFWHSILWWKIIITLIEYYANFHCLFLASYSLSQHSYLFLMFKPEDLFVCFVQKIKRCIFFLL